MVERERETGWSREQIVEKWREIDTGQGPEQRSGDRERGINRSWWTVDGGIASTERESVTKVRESMMREMGK